MCRLRFLEINMNLESVAMADLGVFSFLIGSLCMSLAHPATLEHLRFKIRFRGKNLRSDRSFYEDLRSADVWSRLDSITSHSTGSRLQRVDIDFEYFSPFSEYEDKPDNDEVEKSVLHGLPLLRTKGILFVTAV